jgi:hypothetical protein
MRKRIQGPFVPHGLALLESPAWRSLTREALLLLSRIEITNIKTGGRNNGDLVVTYEDFGAYGIGQRRMIARAIREAEALDLLKSGRGRAGIGRWRQPNCYRLTYLETEDQEPTNEWSAIKTIDDAKARLASVKRRRRPSKWLKAKTAKVVPFSA